MKAQSIQSKPTEVLDLGLVARSSAGGCVIEIDQTVNGAERWFLQIMAPDTKLYIEIASLQIIDQAAKVFASRLEPDGIKPLVAESVNLGEFAGVPISVIFDNEFRDRCFLVLADDSQSSIRLTVAGEGFLNLATALRQAVDELAKEGWLA